MQELYLLSNSPVRIKEGGDAPPPSFSPSQLPTTKSWTTGAGGIQWLLQVAPTVVSPQLVLLQPPSGSKQAGMPPPAVRIKALVPAEGGDWGGGNPVALASSTYCRFTSARLAPAPVRIKVGGDAPPPSFSPSQLPTTKSWTTGAGGIQWLLQVAPTVVSPQLVLLPPSGSKQAGMPPPAVRIKALVPAEGGDWGGGNPVALASSTYCRFTSARLAPAPVRIKAGGDAPPPSFSPSQSGSKKVGIQ